MHAHPTQEACASRGLALDPATKECVTRPPPQPLPAAAAVAVAPSRADQPPPPPAPQPPLGASVPIDSDAKIDLALQQNTDLMSQLAHYVRASGYRCESISALQPLPDSRGYVLICNRFALRYRIATKGDRLTVTLN